MSHCVAGESGIAIMGVDLEPEAVGPSEGAVESHPVGVSGELGPDELGLSGQGEAESLLG